MKTAAFIPIKLNNERMPNKNTRLFSNGKPLMTYVLETLAKVPDIDGVYVYCSQEQVVEFFPKNVKFIKRSESLDAKNTNGTEIIKHFVEDVIADIYFMSHATTPFVSCESFEKGISAVKSGNYDSAFSVEKIQQFLWMNGKPINYDPAYIPRSQDLPGIYGETNGFYVFPRQLVLEHGRRIGFNPFMVELTATESIDIDYEEDFLIADAIAGMKDILQ